MKYLSQLTGGIEVVGTSLTKDIPLYGLSQHSKKIEEGYAFFVSSPQAEEYIEEAEKRGAVLFVGEKPYPGRPYLQVKDVRKAVAVMARTFYDYPDKKMSIVGVVGTNGKTSITQILAKMFDFCGFRTASVGTLGVYIGGKKYESERTTPDAPDLFYYLNEAVNCGVQYLFMEISAHAIYYKKTYGLRCDICVFTNCTPDHLDFFGDMERYERTKMSFFTYENMKCAVINSDDKTGRKILKNDEICCVSYGLSHPSEVFAVNIEYNNGTDFVVNAFDDILYIHSPLFGEYNVSNLLAALTVGKLYGIDARELERAVLSLGEIDGRFNVIPWKAKIVIDYAHTPDGLMKVLSCARKMCSGRLMCLFGCGGERDKTKRPVMGKIASDLADVTVITSDNPRSEDPVEIIGQIRAGTDKDVFTVTDRKEAVSFLLDMAKGGDVVVLCGKGAENYIEIKGEKVPYSDKEACLSYIGSHPCRK